jgi:hypothetical protein
MSEVFMAELPHDRIAVWPKTQWPNWQCDQILSKFHKTIQQILQVATKLSQRLEQLIQEKFDCQSPFNSPKL